MNQHLVEDPSSPAAAPESMIRQPDTVQTQKDAAVFASRMVDDLDPDALGTHIDTAPHSRTPLTGMKDPNKGDTSLAGSIPGKEIQFGWRSNKKKPPVQDAIVWDKPRTPAKKNEKASQVFETAALAVEGAQLGAYYGSVRWGFIKESSEEKTKTIEFSVLQSAAPSANFLAAAEKWNASKNTADEPSIPLPKAFNKFLNAGSDLKEGADKGKSRAKLDLNTRVETMDDPPTKGWQRVVVTSGDSKGMVGWVKAADLSDRETIVKGKK
jgi:hypothetical protein